MHALMFESSGTSGSFSRRSLKSEPAANGQCLPQLNRLARLAEAGRCSVMHPALDDLEHLVVALSLDAIDQPVLSRDPA